ncbi:MAG: hypothetical protein MUE83_00835 [Tabrizicola sp.]|jgi:hypothetical protein|nr:hypothetical protein [Tabrizicola sp.]
MSITLVDTISTRVVEAAKRDRVRVDALLAAISRVDAARTRLEDRNLSEAAEYLALLELTAAEEALLALVMKPDVRAELASYLSGLNALIEAQP